MRFLFTNRIMRHDQKLRQNFEKSSHITQQNYILIYKDNSESAVENTLRQLDRDGGFSDWRKVGRYSTFPLRKREPADIISRISWLGLHSLAFRCMELADQVMHASVNRRGVGEWSLLWSSFIFINKENYYALFILNIESTIIEVLGY